MLAQFPAASATSMIGDARTAELAGWIASWRPDCSGAPLQRLRGDAGQRRYFRVNAGRDTLVAVDAPPATEDTPRFLAIRERLQRGGVRVPALHAADAPRGFLLLEDLGESLMLDVLATGAGPGLEQVALATLADLHRVSPTGMPAYTAALLGEEFDRCAAWFIERLLGLAPSARGEEALAALRKALLDSALEQPSVFVHRDFHSRNLMRLDDGSLAVIDFQDAVAGPVTYDLVSLLRDCYWYRAPAAVAAHAEAFRAAHWPGIAAGTWQRWLDWMGLQRHIKVLGTFARLSLRDGRNSYLDDLPLVWTYILEVLDAYPDAPALQAFADYLAAEVAPVVRRQSWYRACA